MLYACIAACFYVKSAFYETLIYLLGFRRLDFMEYLNSQVISDILPVDISEKGLHI